MTKKVDIKEFAREVERFCDFFLDKVSSENERSGSDDLKIIEDLKELAADIQFDKVSMTTNVLSGLSAYMKGVTPQ